MKYPLFFCTSAALFLQRDLVDLFFHSSENNIQQIFGIMAGGTVLSMKMPEIPQFLHEYVSRMVDVGPTRTISPGNPLGYPPDRFVAYSRDRPIATAHRSGSHSRETEPITLSASCCIIFRTEIMSPQIPFRNVHPVRDCD